MKKILVIDESELFREFLKKKLQEYGFEVFSAVNGLDGSVKLRQSMPDLVIMDYYLSRTSSIELLQKKKDDPNVASVPVILVSSKIDRDRLIQIARFGVKKFFTKPIKVDSLLKTVGELLKVNLDLDSTPCIIEAHVNDDILFVEVAQGLNKEKIELLKYKIAELLDLYEIKNPRVLVIMSSIEVTSADSIKLSSLVGNILEHTGTRPRLIKILTNSEYVRKYIEGREDLKEIEVTSSLERAMDGLLGRKAGSYMDEERRVVQHEFLQTSAPRKSGQESINMQFEGERSAFSLDDLGREIRIAVVDDDFVIQELIRTAFSDNSFQIRTYDNGKKFFEDPEVLESDLIFLDLMMPEMNGFQVLEELKKRNIELQIIVLSALSKKETVIEALKFGVKSYMIKPLKPEWIQKKAAEVLRLNF